MRRMSMMEPHHSHLSHKKAIVVLVRGTNKLMRYVPFISQLFGAIEYFISHHSHKNRQEAEETEGITSIMV